MVSPQAHQSPIFPSPLFLLSVSLGPTQRKSSPSLLPSEVWLPSPKSVITVTALLLSDGAAEKPAQTQFSFQCSNMRSTHWLSKWTHCFLVKSRSAKGKLENKTGRGFGDRGNGKPNFKSCYFFLFNFFHLSFLGWVNELCFSKMHWKRRIVRQACLMIRPDVYDQ